MYISLADSCAKGFRRWSDAHEPHGNDNEGDVARVDALTGADSDIAYAAMTPPERTSRPWLVAGVGNTF